MPIITNLERAILKTIIFFDLFDYPLTSWEIHKFLISAKKTSYQAVCHALQNTSKILDFSEGFYFLKNRAQIIQTRKERYLLARKKYQTAKKNAALLSKLPGVKAIFMCNTLALSNSSEDGDLDFFIVTEKNQIWSARFFTVGLMSILGRRPKKNLTKDKICLSFFLSEDNLNIKKYAYSDDWYLIFWLNTLVPIYDPDNFLPKITAENSWTASYLANIFPAIINRQRVSQKKSFLNKFCRSLLPDFFAGWAKNIQLKNLPREIMALSRTKNIDVVLDDKILKFHLNDRRKFYNEKFTTNCQKTIPRIEAADLAKIIAKAL